MRCDSIRCRPAMLIESQYTRKSPVRLRAADAAGADAALAQPLPASRGGRSRLGK